jgi:DNA helicase-2/ATP-dependent DNA helicase PcrA
MGSFGSSYSTPGWQRAQARKGKGGFSESGAPRYTPDGVFDQREEYDEDGSARSDHLSPGGRGRPGAARSGEGARAKANAPRRAPLTIEGELIAKSTGTSSAYSVGDRVFHLKFGNGNVTAVDGNKLTIRFDKAGEKRVVDSFVERV